MKNIKIYAFADEASEKIDEQIIAMKRNNLNGLEIRNVDGTNVSDLTREHALEVRKKLDDAGLVTWSIGSPIGKIDIVKDNFAAHIEKFKNTLDVANILGSKNIRLFSFYMPSGSDYADYKSEVIDRMGRFLEIAKGTGINLCHENEKGIYGDTAERCLEIYKALPDIKGIFDPANFVQCGQDTKKAWDILKDQIYYIHIKDALGDGSIVPAGMGNGNIKYILNEYIKTGGNSFTIEPHLALFGGLQALEKDGNTSEIGKKYIYKNNNEAFDAACNAFKILCSCH